MTNPLTSNDRTPRNAILAERLRLIGGCITSRPVLGHWPAMAAQSDADSLENAAKELLQQQAEIERLTRELAMSDAGGKLALAERDRLRAALEELADETQAVMHGEHGADWADHFTPLFNLIQRAKALVSGEPASAPETAGSRTDDAILRGLLAATYSGSALYRDDGKLQDNSEQPFIDYLRDSVLEIERKITERGHTKLAAAAEPVSTTLRVGLTAVANPLVAAAAQPTPGSWGIFCGIHGFTEWRTECPQCTLGSPQKASGEPHAD